jgi:phosphopantetheine--protein transferase-like protein
LGDARRLEILTLLKLSKPQRAALDHVWSRVEQGDLNKAKGMGGMDSDCDPASATPHASAATAATTTAVTVAPATTATVFTAAVARPSAATSARASATAESMLSSVTCDLRDGTRPHSPRIGADVVSVADVDRSVETFGDRYLDRIYTPLERAQTASSVERIAARFAGKEAVMKVLRVRSSESIPFLDIEIASLPSGAPHVRLRGAARDSAAEQSLERITISLSHDGDTAFAVALGEFGPAGGIPTTNARVRSTLARHGGLNVPIDRVADDQDLYDVGLTSIAYLGVLHTLEDETSLSFPDELLERATSTSIASIGGALDSIAESRTRPHPDSHATGPEE